MIICIVSMSLSFYLVGGVFQCTNVCALENLEILGENIEFYVEETPFKTVYRAVMENGQEYSSEYIKSTGKVYMNGHEVEYSFTDGIKVSDEFNKIDMTKTNVYSRTGDIPAETIITGYTVDFAPLIDGAISVAALGTQLYTAMLGVGASTLINKLAKATLRRHWAAVADVVGGNVLGLIGANGSKIVNVTFKYDLQKSIGLVDLMGNGVLVTAYRYANYTGIIKLLGNTFTNPTGEKGSWWSNSKPYGLDLPIEDI